MKALNQKERVTALFTILLFFIPMIGTVVLGMTFQNQVKRMHLGDLEQKKAQYEYALKAQSRQGWKMDEILTDLENLRIKKDMTYTEHRLIQKGVNSKLNEMASIQLTLEDTSLTRIRMIPAIYDSLIKDIKLIQSTRDTIITCEDEISNQKFLLDQCLEALKERLYGDEQKGESP